MAEIAVVQKPGLPLWAALLGLSAMIVTVWLLFMLGVDAGNRVAPALASEAASVAYDVAAAPAN